MASLKSLASEVRACAICIEHLPAGPRPVIQVGRSAKILIAGQAPGRRVHESGVPFQDPSGDRLRDWLGVTSEEFYDPKRIAILPMGFCYPGTGKSGDLPPQPECAPAWREPLLKALPKVELTFVLGQYALAYHLPKRYKTLTAAVEDWESVWPAMLPLPHPSPRNQRWFRNNAWFETDVLPKLRRRVRRLLKA